MVGLAEQLSRAFIAVAVVDRAVVSPAAADGFLLDVTIRWTSSAAGVLHETNLADIVARDADGGNEGEHAENEDEVHGERGEWDILLETVGAMDDMWFPC